MATDSPSGVVKRWVIDDLEAYRKEHAGDAPSSKYRFFQTTEKAANPGKSPTREHRRVAKRPRASGT